MRYPVTLTCHAKVNLCLAITARDTDGYHELVSAVCFTSFGDKITISPAAAHKISYEGPFAKALQQAGGDSLMQQTAALAGQKEAHHILLNKQIPLGGGLGGGSADAAAYLRYLSAHLSEKDKAQLRASAEALGADVPACFDNHAHIMAGRGAQSYPIEMPDNLPVMVITNPLIHSDTGAVFARYAQSSLPFRDITAQQISALFKKAAWGDIMAIGNDLTNAACQLYPQIDTLLYEMGEAGKQIGDDFIAAQMTGSGASCFALLQDEKAAKTYCEKLTEKGIWAVVTDLF